MIIGNTDYYDIVVGLIRESDDNRANYMALVKAGKDAGFDEGVIGTVLFTNFQTFELSVQMQDGTFLDGNDAQKVLGEVMREERDDGADIKVFYRLRENA